MALAVAIKSGFTPQCREPDHDPARPKAVITSSAISKIPFLVQISRTIGIKLSCGGITPPAPKIGSIIIAAIVSAPWNLISSSNAAVHSWAKRAGSVSLNGLRYVYGAGM